MSHGVGFQPYWQLAGAASLQLNVQLVCAATRLALHCHAARNSIRPPLRSPAALNSLGQFVFNKLSAGIYTLSLIKPTGAYFGPVQCKAIKTCTTVNNKQVCTYSQVLLSVKNTGDMGTLTMGSTYANVPAANQVGAAERSCDVCGSRHARACPACCAALRHAALHALWDAPHIYVAMPPFHPHRRTCVLRAPERSLRGEQAAADAISLVSLLWTGERVKHVLCTFPKTLHALLSAPAPLRLQGCQRRGGRRRAAGTGEESGCKESCGPKGCRCDRDRRGAQPAWTGPRWGRCVPGGPVADAVHAWKHAHRAWGLHALSWTLPLMRACICVYCGVQPILLPILLPRQPVPPAGIVGAMDVDDDG